MCIKGKYYKSNLTENIVKVIDENVPCAYMKQDTENVKVEWLTNDLVKKTTIISKATLIHHFTDLEIAKDPMDTFQYHLKEIIDENSKLKKELKLVSDILDHLFKDDYGECRSAVGLFKNKEYNFKPMFETVDGNDYLGDEEYEYLKNKYGDYDERKDEQ